MIHLTETLAITLPDLPINPNRTYIIKSLEDYVCSFGGWSGLFSRLSCDSENAEKETLVISLPEIVQCVSVFSRSIYPKASKQDLKRFVVSLIDQHLVLSLFRRNGIIKEQLDIQMIERSLDCEPTQYPKSMLDNLSLEFSLAHYLTTGEVTLGLIRRVTDVAHENFLVLVTSPFFSVLESHLEPVLLDIKSVQEPELKIFYDDSIPLFYDNSVDPVEISQIVIAKYSKEYLQVLSEITLTGRTSRSFLNNASKFLPSVIGQRYDQLKNSDWIGFIESDLGLRYTVFEASTRIGGERFSQKLSKLTIFLLMTRRLSLSF